jgi:hypothetical protein
METMSTCNDATLLIVVTARERIQEANSIAAICGAESCEILLDKSPKEVWGCINQAGSQICRVHFVGPGDLAVEDEQGQCHSKARGSLDLVFLNDDETVSVGELLYKQENARSVISWDTRIGDPRAAQQFAEAFYRSLYHPIEAHRTWSFERQCQAAFRDAKANLTTPVEDAQTGQTTLGWNIDLSPDASQYHSKIYPLKSADGKKTYTSREVNADGSTTYHSAKVVEPNRVDSKGRPLAGRPRILPALSTSSIPLQKYHFSFRPVGEGVILAEGPSYAANSDYW